MDTWLNIAIAFLPGLLIIALLYYLDRPRREPLGLVAVCFVSGIAAVPLAMVMGSVVREALQLYRFDAWHQVIRAFFQVGLTEELAKFLPALYLAQRHEEFNKPYDGILYVASISLGFAALENVLYITDGGFRVGLSRAFTAIPAHACFGIVMGYFMGLAKFSHGKERRGLNITALLAAAALHGFYDLFIFITGPALWAGGVVAYALCIYMAYRAVRLHRNEPDRYVRSTGAGERGGSEARGQGS